MLESLGLIDDSVNWFTNQWSFYAIVLLNVVHHGFPFVAITVLAGLLGVSKEMLEAAAIDGAGAWTPLLVRSSSRRSGPSSRS